MFNDLKIERRRLHNDTPQWHSWKTISDKWLHSSASRHCCCKRICVCVMPREGRCQTSFRCWNAGVFGNTGPSVTRCLFSEPLASHLLKDWKLSALHQIIALRILFSQPNYCWRQPPDQIMLSWWAFLICLCRSESVNNFCWLCVDASNGNDDDTKC